MSDFEPRNEREKVVGIDAVLRHRESQRDLVALAELSDRELALLRVAFHAGAVASINTVYRAIGPAAELVRAEAIRQIEPAALNDRVVPIGGYIEGTLERVPGGELMLRHAGGEDATRIVREALSYAENLDREPGPPR